MDLSHEFTSIYSGYLQTKFGKLSQIRVKLISFESEILAIIFGSFCPFLTQRGLSFPRKSTSAQCVGRDVTKTVGGVKTGRPHHEDSGDCGCPTGGELGASGTNSEKDAILRKISCRI